MSEAASAALAARPHEEVLADRTTHATVTKGGRQSHRTAAAASEAAKTAAVKAAAYKAVAVAMLLDGA